MKKILNIQTIVIFIVLFLPVIVHAQPAYGDQTADAPVDGGLSLLIAGGVGYGVKKVKKQRKNKVRNQEASKASKG